MSPTQEDGDTFRFGGLKVVFRAFWNYLLSVHLADVNTWPSGLVEVHGGEAGVFADALPEVHGES